MTLITRPSKRIFRILSIWVAFVIVFSGTAFTAQAETIPEANERGWVDFVLVCNEGNRNEGGNAGNTMMVVSMNPQTGIIRLAPVTWDTFIMYEGYDVPQRLDQPYRNKGPEETLKVFNRNFNMDIKLFMSLNYLNLASLIDDYGGVSVNITRAERNALNEMVASKKEALQAQANMGFLSQGAIELLASQYYLNDYGPETHLNGLQAAGFGWLQYDSVYNSCNRQVQVIASLFSSVGKVLKDQVVLYDNETGYPDDTMGRRAINLDEMSEEDQAFLISEMKPVFDKSYHNLSDKNIEDITNALARTAYKASRQGVNIFDSVKYLVLPKEAIKEYDYVAGTKGHLVDYAENEKMLKDFLFAEDF